MDYQEFLSKPNDQLQNYLLTVSEEDRRVLLSMTKKNIEVLGAEVTRLESIQSSLISNLSILLTFVSLVSISGINSYEVPHIFYLYNFLFAIFGFIVAFTARKFKFKDQIPAYVGAGTFAEISVLRLEDKQLHHEMVFLNKQTQKILFWSKFAFTFGIGHIFSSLLFSVLDVYVDLSLLNAVLILFIVLIIQFFLLLSWTKGIKVEFR